MGAEFAAAQGAGVKIVSPQANVARAKREGILKPERMRELARKFRFPRVCFLRGLSISGSDQAELHLTFFGDHGLVP